MKPRASAEWVEFEAAVASFLAALDSSAHVRPNVRLPDRHTGRPRQRDVWIETRLFGHFPVSILVSCKRYRRKLNQQDIDAFEGERQSSGAQVGVIYSYAGFGTAALEKARALGISCCRLFRNQPPDIPLELAVPCYCLRSQIRLDVLRVSGGWQTLSTYEELFRLRPRDGHESVLDLIAATFRELDSRAVQEAKAENGVPVERADEIEIELANKAITSVRLCIVHRWKVYRGRIEAYLISGSYSEIDRDFRGEVAFPVIDTQGEHPGPGWELLPEATPIPPGPQLRWIFSQPNVRDRLLEALGPAELGLQPINSQPSEPNCLAGE